VNGTTLALDLALLMRRYVPGWSSCTAGLGARATKSTTGLAREARGAVRGVSPQYRFCPKDPFPRCDVRAAVRWLRTPREQYKLDVDHIGAMGFSAGGISP
jgi:hypothetical protein